MPAITAERRLLHRMWLLGLGLTLCAAIFEAMGFLVPLEGFFFDQRVRRFQFTVPPPTDKLVHLDVNEETLESVGRWPWHRSVYADIVRELKLAGAKVVAWDVTFSDAMDAVQVSTDEKKADVDPDAIFAKALADAGNTILPVDFDFQRPRGGINHFRVIQGLTGQNLELSQDDLDALLRAQHMAPSTEQEFSLDMREASALRLTPLLRDNSNATFEQVAATLLPHAQQQMLGGSIQSRRLKAEFDKYVAAEAARRLFCYSSDDSLKAIQPTNSKPPIPAFAKAMMGCGFVSDKGVGDATVVRSLPLYADYKSQLIPQFGFAATMAYLGVKPEDVRITPDTITLPGVKPGGGDIVIPVHSEYVTGYGLTGLFMDIPVIGTRDWVTMYDYPKHLEVKQHHPLSLVTALRDMRQRVRLNNENVDHAMHEMFGETQEELIQYLKRPHDMFSPTAMVAEIRTLQEWCQLIVSTADALKPEEFVKLSKRDLDEYHSAKTIAAVLPQIAKHNAAFIPLIKQREGEVRALVESKMIFIGSTVAGTDLRTTALHPQAPGVIVHGAIFNGIMTGYFWRRSPVWATYLGIFLVGAAATFTASYFRPVGAFLFTMAIGVGYGLINAAVVFGHWRTVLDMAGPLTAVFLVWTVIPIVRFLTESSMRWRIQRRFSTYVDPALVNYLTEHPDKMRLAGELKEITVVFTDLGGFTTLTEKMRERAVEILSEYMALVIPLIRSHRGYVSKFVGDGLMFFYGAPLENPNQAADAVDTATEMLAAVDGFAAALAKRGLDRLGLRIGINTATMVVGDTGIDTAADYTPLGDGMNLGSRLEGANKMFGTRILISARTVYQLNGRYLVRKIANLIVKGKTEAVMAYEPLCRTEDATDDQKLLVDMTDAMVDAYIGSEFEECVEWSRKIEAKFGKNRMAACYRELAERLIAVPPQAFNGAIQLSEK